MGGIGDCEADQNLSRSGTLLSTGLLRRKTVPLRLDKQSVKEPHEREGTSMVACLLGDLAVCEDFLKGDIKLAHVIFAKAVLVPTNRLEEQTVDAGHGQIKRLVPFRVESFGYNRSGLARVANSDDQILQSMSVDTA